MGPLGVIGTLIVSLFSQDSAAPVRAAESVPTPSVVALATPAPAAADRAHPGHWVSGAFAGPAGSRQYTLYVPGNYDPVRKHMLVVLLHGCTQDAADIARGTRIAEHADREGFLAVLPEQPASANAKKCWNWYDPAHQSRDAGEPSLIAGITEQVRRDYAVDEARIHLAGISAGAAMASIVAVAYPERYASIAIHSGLPWGAAHDVMTALGAMAKGIPDADALGIAALRAMGARARAIPVLVVHGGSDAVLVPANGRQATRQWAVTDARALGVDSLTPRGDESGVANGYHWTRSSLADARGRVMIEQLTVQELGHAWSGGSRQGTFTDERGPDAMDAVVRFFLAHPMTRER